MKSEEAIYIPAYLVFNFNDSEEIISFSNWEVLGDVRYVPPFVAGLEENSKGRVFGRKQNQREYCEFELKYLNADTRVKWERIRRMIHLGYTCLFKTEHLVTPLDGFPFEDDPTSTTGLFAKQTLQFDSAVIELPEDFAFDRIGRGIGQVPVEDVTIRVYKSSPLPVPSSPCSLITMQDFATSPWEIDEDNANELLGIYVEKNSGGSIDTITSYGDGTVKKIVGASEVDVDTMEWSSGAGYYVPVNGPNEIDGTFVFRATIGFTLDGGIECTFPFIQYFSAEINQPPVASDVVITGVTQQGEELSLSWTYSDVNGDLENTSPVDRLVWYAFPTSSEASAGDLTNATQLGTGSTYTIGSGIVGKFIAARVKPYALTGSSPGTAVFSNVLGPVVTSTAAFTYSTTKSGTHTLTLQFNAQVPVGIDWGDGSDLQIITSANSIMTGYTHTYADSSTKNVAVYCDATKVTVLRLSGQSISGTVYIDALTSLVDFQAFGESAMTAINVPAAPIEKFYAYSSGITSLDFPSGVNFNNADIRIYSCSSLASLTFTGTDGTIFVLFAYSTAIGTTLALDGLEFSSGQLYLNNNPNLRTISTTGCTGTITRLRFYSCDIQGDFDFVPEFSGTVQIRGNNNSSMTDFTMSTTSSPKPNLQQFELQNCGLTNNPDLSGFNVAAAVSLNLSNNSAVTGINFGTGNSGAITILTVPATSFEYVSLGGYTFTENCNIDMRDCGMTAAIVNEWLYNMDGSESGDALLPTTGTGTIKMEGTNAAPDGSSGGFDGATSASNISGDGYTLTTT